MFKEDGFKTSNQTGEQKKLGPAEAMKQKLIGEIGMTLEEESKRLMSLNHFEPDDPDVAVFSENAVNVITEEALAIYDESAGDITIKQATNKAIEQYGMGSIPERKKN